MKELLYIDCIVRGQDSRTGKLADAFFSKLDTEKYHVTRIDLCTEGMQPHTPERLAFRDGLMAEGKLDHEFFRYAHQFAAADAVVVAAPFWDLSFPALVKIYIENVSVCDITFNYDGFGLHGICKGQNLIFLTTRGGLYEGTPMEQGSAYMEALKTFFGFDSYACVAAEGLDIQGVDVEGLVAEACRKAEALAASL